MKERSFLHSLNDAVNGFVYVVRHERNMRIHFLIAFFLLMLAAYLRVSRIEWIILSCAATLVLVAEMVNTAIEETIDLVKTTFHPAAKIVKHISAGVVLVTAINSIIVAYFIFSKYWREPFIRASDRIRYADSQIVFVSLAAAIFLVIAAKAWLKRGTPFKGGPASGHAAVAFALWTVVLFSDAAALVKTVTFFLAAIVAQSRIRSHIHSLFEVTVGAAIGILVTALLYKLLG